MNLTYRCVYGQIINNQCFRKHMIHTENSWGWMNDLEIHKRIYTHSWVFVTSNWRPPKQFWILQSRQEAASHIRFNICSLCFLYLQKNWRTLPLEYNSQHSHTKKKNYQLRDGVVLNQVIKTFGLRFIVPVGENFSLFTCNKLCS